MTRQGTDGLSFHATDRMTAFNVGLIIGQRYTIDVDMREGVIAQGNAAIKPHLQ